MAIRSPIIVVLGHVDAGKTSLLDRIRNTSIINKEAGEMTQHIGATEVSIEVIKNISKTLLNIYKFELKIPSLLFIDTPGHEAFSNLRKRGGSVSDFAIIVVDILEGFQKQTYEAIEICKNLKIPFLIALNKIDRIDGWKPNNEKPFIETIKQQDQKVQAKLDEYVYNIVVKLYEFGFDSDRYDRIKDFRKQVAIIPLSARTGEGIPDLLLLISGLSQRFLEEKLKINVEGSGIGVILERKEEKGIGDVIDIILYDGRIKKGDKIAFLTRNGVKYAKIKSLLKPQNLTDIRFAKNKFNEINEVYAAAGIRIVADNLEDALPGSTIYVFNKDEELKDIENRLKADISDIIFNTDKEGIVVKSDTLGSLEVLTRLLKERNIPIKKADIGDIEKNDIDIALSMKEKNIEYAVIVGFNVRISKNAEDIVKNNNVKIIISDIIYDLAEKIDNYIKDIKSNKEKILGSLPVIGKIYVIENNVFRRSNPAIVGVEVLEGKIVKEVYLMNQSGRIVGKILAIQKEKRNLDYAYKKDKVAISIEDAIVGRNLFEKDILYTYITEKDYRTFKNYREILDEDQKNILKEIANIFRKENPSWGL
ncbi:translation initiation factor aIF-2 [Nanobdella aerobiophila]|uniref:Probable translation initiation factor IF-2 n=1 Tax=Nanobdella aerobiophila TaxID=2586965 RepID=A0A915T002_9ARCH|nr:translation initiation factor IF-2 [Nanobdella aerobiophila]BBL45589.1 translation initiation factor aIF-2 [Nanobdella aerobiophila]